MKKKRPRNACGRQDAETQGGEPEAEEGKVGDVEPAQLLASTRLMVRTSTLPLQEHHAVSRETKTRKPYRFLSEAEREYAGEAISDRDD
jgi:hypothetical protein